jgi:predicted RNA binding protein YcfA (HicA-like mRNA interferase family)
MTRNERGSLSNTGVRIMLAQIVLCSLFLACAFTPANALTQEELLARLEAAGYSQVRENGSGKIKTFKAVKNGKEVSVIVDSRGQIKELQ